MSAVITAFLFNWQALMCYLNSVCLALKLTFIVGLFDLGQCTLPHPFAKMCNEDPHPQHFQGHLVLPFCLSKCMASLQVLGTCAPHLNLGLMKC